MNKIWKGGQTNNLKDCNYEESCVNLYNVLSGFLKYKAKASLRLVVSCKQS